MNKFFAGWLPGLPHLLHSEKSPEWKRLHQGIETLGTHLREFRPDVIVLYSTQWLSVLGTSFQTATRARGIHVDENWHEWGDLEFDFPLDAELGRFFAGALKVQGLPSKCVAYEHFPIDTGTLVATRLLDPTASLALSIVSSWVYADADKSRLIGKLMREECEKRNVKAAFIACSLLSTHFTPTEIDPAMDVIGDSDDSWNRKVLNALEAGDLESVVRWAPEYARATAADMQFNAFHWMRGIFGQRRMGGAQIHAYGSLWGAGAAVMEFTGENFGC